MGNINIKGNNVSIINNKIFVDGKEIGTEEKEINIIVELENIYETLTGDIKKKEAFRKNFLDWVKKYVEYLKNEKKKVI